MFMYKLMIRDNVVLYLYQFCDAVLYLLLMGDGLGRLAAEWICE